MGGDLLWRSDPSLSLESPRLRLRGGEGLLSEELDDDDDNDLEDCESGDISL